jgi:hypothetical protein
MNGDEKKRGRPLERDGWADAVWDALWIAHPEGLPPRQLRRKAGLNQHQVLTGIRYLRDTFNEDHDTPVVYIRTENCWYIAPSWKRTSPALRAEFLQQSCKRLRTAEDLLAQAERAFPTKARQIRKIQRNAEYLRAETEDLMEELR